jgi:hypothetical protein
VPADALENELAFLDRVGAGSEAVGWVRRLIALARQICPCDQTPADSEGNSGKAGGAVLIVSGSAASLRQELVAPIRGMLEGALNGFVGTVISGGTTAGVPGCLGDAAGALAGHGRKTFDLLGYLPEQLPANVSLDGRYDRQVLCGADFSAEQILRMWADLRDAGVRASQVHLLGYGGGPISALEYRIALALGATVGLMMRSGGAAEELLRDELWAGERRLLPLPEDGPTLRAFVHAGETDLPEGSADAMGREFHRRYLERRQRQGPSDVRPWEELDETYRAASRRQAREAIQILEAVGFGVRSATGVAFDGFAPAELEKLAELEHGRWNVERLRSGWRPGEVRDNAHKVHNLIVPWGDKVLDRYRQNDVEAVRAIPEVLAKAGLEVYRKG